MMGKKEKVKEACIYKKLTHRFENEIVKFYTLTYTHYGKKFNSWKINAFNA